MWNEDCSKSHSELIQALTSYPILRQPDFAKSFILSTDASGYALGAILSQLDENNKEVVIAYASRLLKGAEVHYSITELECLAVIFGVKQYRCYLYGNHFKIITDHSALNYLMKINDPSGRLARWSIYLQSFDFEIIHRKGINHSNVDALSRPVMVNIAREIDSDEDNLNNLDAIQDEALISFLNKGLHP